ncbi:MAG: BatA and WFA domain-containing protein [Planctomycetota bacterium]|nr:BatA and WFA domain-containing protein [Planctomycetota bacterium]MDA1141652.1 BatA and WFA domain-containing protein [Planctomycetota bacterium]
MNPEQAVAEGFFASHFLNPAALWWLAVLAPLIIILYFLKLKRQQLMIASTLLWQQSIQDLRVNSPFQTLRRNILLFIQLLILLIAVLALARPLMNLEHEGSRRIIVLIDTSASMATEDAEGTRLSAAKKGALELTENMVRADQMSLIRFASQASVISSFTSDKGLLKRHIENLEIQATDTKISEALNIAFSLAKVQADKESQAVIHVFSDGRYSDKTGFANYSGEVKFHSIGKTSRNIGIVALDVGYSSDEDATSEVFYSIENFDLIETEVTAEFYFNDELVGARKHRIDSEQRISSLAPTSGNKSGVLKIKIADGDPFPMDDTGYVVIQRPEQVRVLLVGEGDFFMNQALAVARSKITKLLPAGFSKEMSEKYDIVIFDGWSPNETGRGSFIFHNCHPKLADLKPGEEVEGAQILDWDRAHPVMRFFSLSEVFILRMTSVTPPKWMHVLAQSSAGPLILCSEQESFRSLYMPFHMSRDSNLSAQGTFPIFVMNLLRWLPTTGIRGARQFLTGDTLIAQAGRSESAQVTDPKGRTFTIAAHDGRFMFPNTMTSGIYKVSPDGGEEELYAVNLLSASESKIDPEGKLSVQGAVVQAEAEVQKANREIWQWLVLAGFFLLLFEWYVYNAKVYF